MRPPHQRLHADDAAAVGRVDRLVVQRELVAQDRMAQVVLDDLLHAQRVVHGALEEAEAVPALALGLVEGGVGEAHQHVVALAVLRRQRDPDRHADRDLGARDVEGAADLVEDPPGEGLGIRRGAHPGLDDRELVAAEAGEGVGAAQQVGEPLGDLLDQFVAGGMAVGVVHVLEPVEVEEHDRDAALRAAEAADLHVEPLGEEEAVRQARQRVASGEELGPLLARREVVQDPAERDRQDGEEDQRRRDAREQDGTELVERVLPGRAVDRPEHDRQRRREQHGERPYDPENQGARGGARQQRQTRHADPEAGAKRPLCARGSCQRVAGIGYRFMP